MSREANIDTQLRMIEAVNSGRLEALHDIFTTNVIDHDAAVNQGEGPAGYIAFFAKFREAFPDLNVNIEHMTADHECIAIAVRVTGTHRGMHAGVPATGRVINVRGMQIAKFDEFGKIKERWGSSDELTVLRQIGVLADVDSAEPLSKSSPTADRASEHAR